MGLVPATGKMPPTETGKAKERAESISDVGGGCSRSSVWEVLPSPRGPCWASKAFLLLMRGLCDLYTDN